MYLIIVSGASGSGKSTIVNLIKLYLSTKSERQVDILSMDQFYKSLKPGDTPNWDDVSAIDTDYLVTVLTELKSGVQVNIPKYDYVTHQRMDNSYTISDCDILILEGIFTLWHQQIRDLADLKVYIDADPLKVCLPRRYLRDTTERGRSGESIIDQYINQVLPGFEKFVVPTRKYADLCYLNEGIIPNVNDKFIRILGHAILNKL